jgi:hypothetical protein
LKKEILSLAVPLNIMVKFDLYCESNIVSNPEIVKIGVDNHLAIVTELPLSQISFDVELDSGPHIFWIELCGKTQENELRDCGQLVEDTFLHLVNLSINGSMMHHLLNDLGAVTPDWNHHSDVANWFNENRGGAPEQLLGCKYINLKGVYRFNFWLPIRDFLNSQIKIDPRYQQLYNAPIEKYLQLREKILRIK